MKKLTISLLFILGALGLQLMATQAQASEVVKIPAPKVTDTMDAQALETGLGQVIPMTHIVTETKLGARRVLNQGRIDLKNGEVLYPEEIRFVHVRSAERAPREFDRKTERAPREWD